MANKEKKRTFGSVVLGTYLRLKGALPLGYHYFWADFFAWILRTVRYRYSVVVTNLARSFPDKKYKELKKITKEVYLHFGEMIAEAIWFGGCQGKNGPKRLHKQNIMSITNPEVLSDLYDSCSNGLMILCAHSGNWEMWGGFLEYNYDKEHPLSFGEDKIAYVYKELHSRTWDIIMRNNRLAVFSKDFKGYVETGRIIRHAVKRREDKDVYFFITDQHPYKGAAMVDVGEFMHQPTGSMAGGAALASRFGMAVAYMSCLRTERGHYDITIVPMYKDATGVDTAEIMKGYYSLLEKDLISEPANYLWTHKRWK